jgi:hypothetical protein
MHDSAYTKLALLINPAKGSIAPFPLEGSVSSANGAGCTQTASRTI